MNVITFRNLHGFDFHLSHPWSCFMYLNYVTFYTFSNIFHQEIHRNHVEQSKVTRILISIFYLKFPAVLLFLDHSMDVLLYSLCDFRLNSTTPWQYSLWTGSMRPIKSFSNRFPCNRYFWVEIIYFCQQINKRHIGKAKNHKKYKAQLYSV